MLLDQLMELSLLFIRFGGVLYNGLVSYRLEDLLVFLLVANIFDEVIELVLGFKHLLSLDSQVLALRVDSGSQRVMKVAVPGLLRAIIRWMGVTAAVLATDLHLVLLDLFRAVVEFVTLSSTVLAPDTLRRGLVISYNGEPLGFLCLLNDSVHHLSSFLQSFIRVGRQQHVERFIFINFILAPIDLKEFSFEVAFTLHLRAFSSDLNPTLRFLLQALLGLPSWSDDLSDVVDGEVGLVLRLRNEDLLRLLWGLVVGGCFITRIHSQHFGDQEVPLLVGLVFQAEFSSVRLQSSFRIVDGWRTGRSEVCIVELFEVL
mmetsp:Transcript_42706/g.65563  ORF Transcript_42706/g.65563 Transcript_42706/m.65563 type:complete len:316 (-) Transcript_42706:752-1699(-)